MISRVVTQRIFNRNIKANCIKMHTCTDVIIFLLWSCNRCIFDGCAKKINNKRRALIYNKTFSKSPVCLN